MMMKYIEYNRVFTKKEDVIVIDFFDGAQHKNGR